MEEIDRLADGDNDKPITAAASDGDETAVGSAAGLTEAMATAAQPAGSNPGSAHAWSLDHGEETDVESKWPARLRWGGLVALLCATVAAVMWFSIVFYFDGRSNRNSDATQR